MNPSQKKQNHSMLSRSYASEEKFLRDYRKFCDKPSKAKEFYLLLLTEIEKAISEGKIAELKKLNIKIGFINNVIDHEILRNYYEDISNPIRNTNLIILASKHNKVKILEYLFESHSTVLKNLSEDIGKTTVLPEDKDEANHNAFYYATRSGNTHLINILITKWPDNYFAVHKEKLEEIIANSYQELKLKNVLLSSEMEVFVERKLLDFRFFSSGQDSSANKTDLNKTEERITLLLKSINLLKQDYLNTRKIDGKFVYVAKFIAQNIHILKGRLRSTYDRIPWEEMEFCLVIFISSQTSREELNLFYGAFLGKEKLLNYLENFANKLKDEEDITKGDQLHRLPRGQTREDIVKNIIKSNPQFEEFYNVYHQIRDIYSLKKISDYVKLAVSADAQEDQGRFVIIRVIQSVGEHLKSTLESPKLSHATGGLLLLSLSQSARKIIMELRDAISHADSLLKLLEIEENEDVNFFINIQSDIRKVGDVITDIFYRNKMKTIRMLLRKIVESETLTEIKGVLEDLGNADWNISNIIENFKSMEHETLEKLIKEISDNIADKTDYENALFNEINNILNDNCLDDIRLRMHMGYMHLESYNIELKYNKIPDKIFLRIIKTHAEDVLIRITGKINPDNYNKVFGLLNRILQSVKPRIQNDKFYVLKSSLLQIRYINAFKIGELEWIDELREKVPKPKKPKLMSDDKDNNHLKIKLDELKVIIDNNSLNALKGDKKLQFVLKMLVLDILVFLDDCLKNNHLFLDENILLLHGKCLRNHLAHDNAIVDVLLSDLLIALKLNAEKLTEEPIMELREIRKKIGKLVSDDPVKLKKKFDQNLDVITIQEKMFLALEEGDLDDSKNCIDKGADIKARSIINSWTTLHFAAKGPNLEVARFIIDQHLNVDVKDNIGQTPLHIAAAHGRADIVNLFLKETAAVDVQNNNGKTPLHFAAENGHKAVVKILLKNKANIFINDKKGRPPLYYAVKNNRIDVTEILLEKDLNFDINEAMGGLTALHIAANNGSLELVIFLLKNGANVKDVVGDGNVTPLHLAAMNGNLEVVNALISFGANINARTSDNMMPLHCAVYNNNINLVKSLLTDGAYINTATTTSPLHVAALLGHLEIATVLLKHGANINATFNNMYTPLHCAALNGHKEVVEFLIQNGAQINTTESNIRTALHAAIMKGNKDIAYLLIKNKAAIHAQFIGGDTAIHIAALKGNKDIIDILISYKAEVNTRNCAGHTPLHLATYGNHASAVKSLIKNKADVNDAEIKTGFTPLFLAAFQGNKEIVNLLIENNGQINTISAKGISPLRAATLAGHKEIVEIMVAAGANINDRNCIPTLLQTAIIYNYTDIVETFLKNKADVNYKDVNHFTPLHTAAVRGRKEMVKALIKYGANVHARSNNSETPLFLAAQRGFKGVVEILIASGVEVNLNYPKDKTPLHAAALEGHSNIVKVLLNNKADIDINDNTDQAPIRLAAVRGHFQVVRTLLRHLKVNIEAKDENGYTLLHISLKGNNLELVKYLVDEGSDINARTSNGLQAIHVAAIRGFKEGVEFFLNKGLSFNELGTHNETLLHCASMGGHLELVNYLIHHHADVNAKETKNGFTPMHFAAEGGYIEIIQVLLENNAIYNDVDLFSRKPLEVTKNKIILKLLESTDKLFKSVERNDFFAVQNYITAGAFVNAINTNGVRPLHCAAEKGYDNIARVLLQNKANPNVVDNNGLTPLHYAAKFSHLKVVKALLSYYAVYDAVSDGGKTPLDFSVDKGIISLFKLVTKLFKSIKYENPRVIRDLNKIRNINTVKAVMCARNKDNKTLVVAAMQCNFSKVQQLKDIAQGDVSARINKAQKLLHLERYQEALATFTDAFKKRKEILGSDNPGTLDIQKSIAYVLLNQGDYQEALDAFEDILRKQKEILGLDSKDALETSSSIALAMYKQGKDEEAFAIFQEVYQKQKKMLEPYHRSTLITQCNMALVLNRQQKHEEALNIFRSVYESKKLKSKKDLLYCQSNVAMTLADLGNYEEALNMFQEIYNNMKMVFGVNHLSTLETKRNIGAILSKQHKLNKSLAVFQEVLLKLQEKVLKPNHPNIVMTKLCIAAVLQTQNKWISLLKIYRDGFDQLKGFYGLRHQHVSDVLKTILRMYSLQINEKEPSNVLRCLQEKINVAAGKGDVQTVQFWLDDGADANDKDPDGRTPLHYAIYNGHINVVNMLLKHGADVTQVTNKGNTPLHTASSKGYVAIAEILLRHVSPNKLNGFLNAKTTAGGITSLHVAAKNGFMDIVIFLLKRGVIYNITSNEGKTPLDHCKCQKISDLLKLVDELFQDAKYGNMEIISKLKMLTPHEYEAVQNVRSSQNWTLLQVIIKNKHLTLAQRFPNGVPQTPWGSAKKSRGSAKKSRGSAKKSRGSAKKYFKMA